MLIELKHAALCPNDHICDSMTECPCGSTNLIPLGKILDRVATGVDAALEMVREFKIANELYALPSMRREFGDN